MLQVLFYSISLILLYYSDFNRCEKGGFNMLQVLKLRNYVTSSFDCVVYLKTNVEKY